MYAPHVLPAARDYAALYRSFRWQVPARYNIGIDACDRWAETDPGRIAILNVRADGGIEEMSYGDLRETSNRLANVLAAHGIAPGDRVAILLPQAPAVAAAHMAIYKLGAIALPLAMLFGVEALSYRLRRFRRARADYQRAGIGEARRRPAKPRSNLALVLSVDGAGDGALGFVESLARASSEFTARDTAADDPALMVYTSGTTGSPKGALHAHRVLLGHLPGIEFPHEFLPQPGDRFWTPADWAWAGGLLNVLLPGLHYGVPVVARPVREVRSGRGLRADGAHWKCATPSSRRPRCGCCARLATRAAVTISGCASVGSGGEALGAETLEWGKSALGLSINEFYGQTECNLVVASCAAIGVSKPGAIGKPVPGHTVGVIRAGWLGVRAGRNRADRDPAARSGDVSGILGQARRHAGEVHRRLDDDRRPGRHRR